MLFEATGQSVMDAIAAAVTPVVMISANAILIGSISSKHQSMSERIRELAREWRGADASESRRAAIREQIVLFQRRLRWIAGAHILFYISTGFFTATVIVIAVTSLLPIYARVAFPLLVGGVLLTLAAILFEILDLKHGCETMAVELRDVLH